MNVIARLEYELAYYDSAVHRFNHYTTRTPHSGELQIIDHSVAGSMTAQPPGFRLSPLRVATHGQQMVPFGGVLPLCKGGFGIFHSPSRQGNVFLLRSVFILSFVFLLTSVFLLWFIVILLLSIYLLPSVFLLPLVIILPLVFHSLVFISYSVFLLISIFFLLSIFL